MENYIAIALSLVAVILCVVILSKVNKILDNLHTPIVKKLTPDMNLKPNSRRPVGAQEMAQCGDRNKDNRNKDRQNKENRAEKNGQSQQGQGRDRNEQREGRGNRRDRREGRPQRREFNAEAPAAERAAAPAAEAPAAAAEPVNTEARRPLAPRIPVETPAAPVAEAAPAVAVAAAPAEVAPVETTFDPSKVRYGRRNVIKKAPELADDEA